MSESKGDEGGKTALRLFPSYNNEMKMSLPRSVLGRLVLGQERSWTDGKEEEENSGDCQRVNFCAVESTLDR